MAILMSLAGNTAGDGFLIAPVGSTYQAELLLWTDAGTASVTLQASPNPAGLVFAQTALNLSTAPTSVTVHATAQSSARQDTTIQVLDGANVVATFTVTSIKHPIVNFRGRFEARFSTDNAPYNRNPMYTATNDAAVPPGWTWGLEGEPDFVPAVGNVPENLETPVGRVVRFNSPVALRAHAAPVVTTVDAISGKTTAGTERFTTGDPLIGEPVNLGPNTYLAGNNPQNPVDPQPEEIWGAALEPMALFELHLGNRFRGGSKIGPFTGKATTVNQHTRVPDDRPIANGLVGAAAELAAFALPNLMTWSETRIDQLVADYNALPAGDSVDRRNLKRRIGHLLSSVSPAKRTAVQAANPGEFTVRAGTLMGGWAQKEVYRGKVNANLMFAAGGSAMVQYMSGFTSFNFEWNPFGFHSDELCGHHWGTLTPDINFHGSYTGDPHTYTVDGTAYDFQSVGEFTLLRDGDELEIQVRQTPVDAANPITDSYSGLQACVSVITAVAARVGRYTVSYQPVREGRLLQLFVNGGPTDFPPLGIDLGPHRVSMFDADGEQGLRIDYADGTVFTATPAFWGTYSVWYMNVAVSQTRADEGIMGYIPSGSWLPRLRDGADLGPMPASLQDRYDALYRTFADSWRIDDQTSLFVYEPGTSTETFTDRDWPGERPPCSNIKPELAAAGTHELGGMAVEEAEMICRVVTEGDLYANCVFDVATTGDDAFAKDYVATQELRLYGTKVDIEAFEAPFADRIPRDDEPERARPPFGVLAVAAKVSALTPGRPVPTGLVTFIVDGTPMKRPAPLDALGRARTMLRLKPGDHVIRAAYTGGGRYEYHSSTSPNLLHSVEDEDERRRQDSDDRRKSPAAS